MVVARSVVPAGPLELASVVRAPLVVVADPAVADLRLAGPHGDLAGGGAALLQRPVGSILVVAHPGQIRACSSGSPDSPWRSSPTPTQTSP